MVVGGRVGVSAAVCIVVECGRVSGEERRRICRVRKVRFVVVRVVEGFEGCWLRRDGGMVSGRVTIDVFDLVSGEILGGTIRGHVCMCC